MARTHLEVQLQHGHALHETALTALLARRPARPVRAVVVLGHGGGSRSGEDARRRGTSPGNAVIPAPRSAHEAPLAAVAAGAELRSGEWSWR